MTLYNHYIWRMIIWVFALCIIFDILSGITTILDIVGVFSEGIGIVIGIIIDIVWIIIAYGIPFTKFRGWFGAMFPHQPMVLGLGLTAIGIATELIPYLDLIPIALIFFFSMILGYRKINAALYYKKFEIDKNRKLPVFDILSAETHRQIEDILLLEEQPSPAPRAPPQQPIQPRLAPALPQ